MPSRRYSSPGSLTASEQAGRWLIAAVGAWRPTDHQPALEKRFNFYVSRGREAELLKELSDCHYPRVAADRLGSAGRF